MAEKNTNLGFEKQISDATCMLQKQISGTEYRQIITGLFFLRCVSNECQITPTYRGESLKEA